MKNIVDKNYSESDVDHVRTRKDVIFMVFTANVNDLICMVFTVNINRITEYSAQQLKT